MHVAAPDATVCALLEELIRLISALVLVLLIVTPSLGQQFLVGTHKLVSLFVGIECTPNEIMGKAPHGYFILKPTHAIMFFTADSRKFGTSVAKQAALFDTLVG